MARTRKDRLKWMQKHWVRSIRVRSYLTPHEAAVVNNWCKQTPSWWNHLFSTTKRRRKERDLLKKVTVRDNDYIWPLDKKPHIYYW